MRSRRLERRRLARIGDTSNIFRHHFENHEWGARESVSGPGSTLAYTENIRREIPKLVNLIAAQTILDAPCGDFHWFRAIEWEVAISYIGGDIVQPLVEQNQSLYGAPNRRFVEINIIHDKLPSADLWLCRDCLFHLSNRDIMLAIDNFLRSDIPYLLTSTHSACTKNTNVPTGSFRLLNLQLPPFNFCKPITMIDDWIEGYPVRHLALWHRENLRISLATNRAFRWTRLTSRR